MYEKIQVLLELCLSYTTKAIVFTSRLISPQMVKQALLAFSWSRNYGDLRVKTLQGAAKT